MGHGGVQAGLGNVYISRSQPRLAEQRSEERHEELIGTARLLFRGRAIEARVLNISTRGSMVECEIVPRIGEAVQVTFEGCSPIHAFVRWVKGGRLGLNFGHEILVG